MQDDSDAFNLPRPLVRETALIRAYPSANDRRLIDFRTMWVTTAAEFKFQRPA